MPISVPPGTTVTFTDHSSGASVWYWTFGDGATSTSQNPTHSYSSAGVYTVSLTVTTQRGIVTAYDTVTVVADGDRVYTKPTPAYEETEGAKPVVCLRLSNDGGKTWGAEMQREAGRRGEYWRRVRWNRLGMARRRVFEVVVTDPIPWRLTGAYVDMSEGGA